MKCLHTHYAWYLAGGDDPVGRWVREHLDESRARGARPLAVQHDHDIITQGHDARDMEQQ